MCQTVIALDSAAVPATVWPIREELIRLISLVRYPIIQKCGVFGIAIKSLLDGRGDGKETYTQNQLQAITLRMNDMPKACRTALKEKEVVAASWEKRVPSLTASQPSYPQTQSLTIFDHLLEAIITLFASPAPLPTTPNRGVPELMKNLLGSLHRLADAIEGIEVYWRRRLDFAEQSGAPFTATWEQLASFEPAWRTLHSGFSELSVRMYGAGSKVAKLDPPLSTGDL